MAKHKPIDLASFVVLFYDRIGYSHYTGSLNSLSKVMNIDIKTLKSYIASLEEIGHFEKWSRRNQTIFHCKSVRIAFQDILCLGNDSMYIRVYRPFGKKKGYKRLKTYQYENLTSTKKALKEAILLHRLMQQRFFVEKAIRVRDALKNRTIASGENPITLDKRSIKLYKDHRTVVVTGSRHISNNILHTSKSDAHNTLKRLERNGIVSLKPELRKVKKYGQGLSPEHAKSVHEGLSNKFGFEISTFLNKRSMKLNYFMGTIVLLNF